MFDLFRLWFGGVLRIFRDRRSLMLENLTLRQQLAVLKRKNPRPRMGPLDKLFWVVVPRLWSQWKEALFLVQPENCCSLAPGRVQTFLAEVAGGGVDLVALVGKEPFADQRGIELLEFLDRLSGHGRLFRYGVVTNGTLIHRFIDRIPQSISYIDISLDGTREANDSVRGSGVFDRACHNVRLLMERGFEVWISSVLHTANQSRVTLTNFVREISTETGCCRFYFSPVRNFTGSLRSFLLSFQGITEIQNDLTDIAERELSVGRIILDHPYEAVWRDYIFPHATGLADTLHRLGVDQFGNVLHRLSPKCYRKLDIFPHGPWGTCRIDARGEYLPDVESRTYASPLSVGSIVTSPVKCLFPSAMREQLVPMLEAFVRNMEVAVSADAVTRALATVSIPMLDASTRSDHGLMKRV